MEAIVSRRHSNGARDKDPSRPQKYVHRLGSNYVKSNSVRIMLNRKKSTRSNAERI